MPCGWLFHRPLTHAPADLDALIRPMKPLFVLLIALPTVHGVALASSFVLPIAAPAMIADTGMSPAFVGVYAGIGFSCGTAAAFFSGAFIRRFGGWRIGQFALFASVLGMLTAPLGGLPFLIISAICVGGAYSMLSPAGSHVMARYVTPRQAPLFFSIKQTGVPLAGILAGAIVPIIVLNLRWEYAFLVFALIAAALILAIHPYRAEFDQDRQPDFPLSAGDAFKRLRVVMTTPAYRRLSVVAFFFVGLQTVFSAFFVVYVVDVAKLDLAVAGNIFAVAQALAVFARIAWGWIGGRWVPARIVIGFLGIGMGVAGLLMTQFSPEWPVLAIGAVAALMSATALGWQGLIMAEIARQVPLAEVGPYTGGIMSTASLSAAASPFVMSGILAVTGSYEVGFALLGLPALAAGLVSFFPTRPVPGGGAGAKGQT